jgi:hypothetical protein
MTERLFDRQSSLLAYLTSSGAIFGDRDASVGTSIAGIDCALLRLEARFSHQKRMEKIAAAFPQTFKLLGPGFDRIAREFVESCPPIEIDRLTNARQFHCFLMRRWPQARPEPPYLLDVAGCELACAEVRNAQPFEPLPGRDYGIARPSAICGPAIRRHPAMRLLLCAYDVRPLFEAKGIDEPTVRPPKRDTPLAIVLPPNAEHLQVLELLPAVYELLVTVQDWTDLAEFGTPTELDTFVDDLASLGLIEVSS